MQNAELNRNNCIAYKNLGMTRLWYWQDAGLTRKVLQEIIILLLVLLGKHPPAWRASQPRDQE